jgi:hypothetical protein
MGYSRGCWRTENESIRILTEPQYMTACLSSDSRRVAM